MFVTLTMKATCGRRGLFTLLMISGLVFTDALLHTPPDLTGNSTKSFSTYENSIVLSMLSNAGHLLLVPGTPYEFSLGESQYALRTKDFNRTRFRSIDIDYRNRVLFCYDGNSAAIYTIPFDWENNFDNLTFETFHIGVSASRSVRIALDWISGNLYWTDPRFAWIVIQKATSQDTFKVLIKDQLKRPEAIAVDPIYKYIFWSDIGTKYTKIERASLAGNDRIEIISRNLINPSSFVIDQQTHRLIWIDSGRETVEMADFDGGGRKIIRRLVNAVLFDVTVFRNIVCVTDLVSHTAFFINKLTGETKNGLIGKGELNAIAIYSMDVQPITGLNPCKNKPCNHICVNEGKDVTCLCKEGYSLNDDGITCTEDLGKFHRAFVQSNKTHICLMDIRRFTGGHIDVMECIYTAGYNINAFDIAMQERRIFVADGIMIYSVNNLVSPSSTERILSAPGIVTDVAFNWRDNTLYWTMDGKNSGIYVVSLSTRAETTVIDENIDNPRCVVVQPFNNNMFWVSGSNGDYTIEMARLTGSGRTTIVASKSNFGATSLVIDEDTNTLYFSDGHLKQCNLNGSDIKTILPDVSPKLVLIYQHYLIIDESGYPFGTMSTFEKTNITVWIFSLKDSVRDVTTMKVLDATLQEQQQGPCDVLNGGCAHICISNNGNKTCKCEFGFIMQADLSSCSSEPMAGEFLVVTDWTHNRIYQVSKETDEVRAIDTDTFGKPIGVVYNQIKNLVIWSTQRYLHSFHLNTSRQTDLIDTGILGFSVERLAIDYTSSNIYCTALNLQSSGKIIVVTPTGKHKTIKNVIGKPKAIALDSKNGFVFWSVIGYFDASYVMKSNMDGSEPRNVSPKYLGLVKPNGIAVETHVKRLYIADGSTDIIHRCSYQGGCSKYYEDTGAQLMDVEIVGNYLYYTAWNRLYITKLRRSFPHKTVIADRSELGRLDDLSVHSASFVPSNTCSANNGLGPCSTLCLPRSNGYTCACEDGVRLLADEHTCENAETDFESSSRLHSRTTPSLSSPQTHYSTITPLPSKAPIQYGTSTSVPTTSTPVVYVSVAVVAFSVCVVVIVAGLVFIIRRKSRLMNTSHGNQDINHIDNLNSISGDQRGRAQRSNQRTTCSYRAANDLIQFEDSPNDNIIAKSILQNQLSLRDGLPVYESIDDPSPSLPSSTSFVNVLHNMDIPPVQSNTNTATSPGDEFYITPS